MHRFPVFSPDAFYENSLFSAVLDGDLDSVKILAKEQFTSPQGTGYRALYDLGEDGQTVLHVALLSSFSRPPLTAFPPNTPIDEDEEEYLSSDIIWSQSSRGKIVAYLIDEYPNLVQFQCLGYRLGGLSPLHIACAQGILAAVVMLVQAGANVNDCHVVGTEFMTEQDDGGLYFGSTPLQFATVAGHDRIVRYLVDHTSVIIGESDIRYGNNILHLLAYHHAKFRERAAIIQYLIEKSIEQSVTLGPTVNLITKKNRNGLTPFLAAVARKHENAFDFIKEMISEFGGYSSFQIPLDDVDPLCSLSDKVDFQKTAIGIALYNGDVDFICHPIIHTVLRLKWTLYAGNIFVKRCVLSIVSVTLLSASLALLPQDPRIATSDSENSRLYSLGTLYSSYFTITDQLRLGFESLYLFCVIISAGIEIRKFQQLGVRQYFGGYLAEENYAHWLIIFLTVFIVILRLLNVFISETNQLLKQPIPSYLFGVQRYGEDTALSILSVVEWGHLLYYAKGFPAISSVAIFFRRFLISVVIKRWIIVALVLQFGFSFAFYLQLGSLKRKFEIEGLRKVDFTVDPVSGFPDSNTNLTFNTVTGEPVIPSFGAPPEWAIMWSYWSTAFVSTLRMMFSSISTDVLNNGKFPALLWTYYFFYNALFAFLFICIIADILSQGLLKEWEESKKFVNFCLAHTIFNIDAQATKWERSKRVRQIGKLLPTQHRTNISSSSHHLSTPTSASTGDLNLSSKLNSRHSIRTSPRTPNPESQIKASNLPKSDSKSSTVRPLWIHVEEPEMHQVQKVMTGTLISTSAFSADLAEISGASTNIPEKPATSSLLPITQIAHDSILITSDDSESHLTSSSVKSLHSSVAANESSNNIQTPKPTNPFNQPIFPPSSPFYNSLSVDPLVPESHSISDIPLASYISRRYLIFTFRENSNEPVKIVVGTKRVSVKQALSLNLDSSLMSIDKRHDDTVTIDTTFHMGETIWDDKIYPLTKTSIRPTINPLGETIRKQVTDPITVPSPRTPRVRNGSNKAVFRNISLNHFSGDSRLRKSFKKDTFENGDSQRSVFGQNSVGSNVT